MNITRFIVGRLHSKRSPQLSRLLPKGTVWGSDAEIGARLVCHTGILWVTLSGDPHDHILSAGDSMTLSFSGQLVMEALETASFSLALPAGRVLPRHLPASV